VVSSTWDSVDRPADYLIWANHVASVSTVVNPVSVLSWGLDKTHQRAFADYGVPTITTTWIEPEQPWSLPEEDFVVKPAVSAGGRATARYSDKDSAAASSHIEQLHAGGQTVMIQPYLDSIARSGEIDLVFVAGRFSHALRKRFALPTGAAIIERPWERLVHQEISTPSPDEHALGAAVAELSPHLAGAAPTYCRVDIVAGPDGGPLLLEVEVVDPYLFLDKNPAAAARMAAAILAPA
jgi:glutathione synthase/RimK-type ligase-like ATP-grasp enzyme